MEGLEHAGGFVHAADQSGIEQSLYGAKYTCGLFLVDGIVSSSIL